MNYDLTDIPAGYDRARDHGPAMLALWMNHIDRHIALSPRPTILDLGCGTGRFADALAAHFEAMILGLDPSPCC
jgi:cyclopropane fatty-acyl-phospholipid synthase-like methyltransferase